MKKPILLGTACACLLTFALTPALASVVYNYSGNVFDTFINDGSALYGSASSVTGSIELATPLAPGGLTEITSPVNFSFTDGLQTLTPANTDSFSFRFWTDAAGLIVEWEAQMIRDMPLSPVVGDTWGTILTDGTPQRTDDPFGFEIDQGVYHQCTAVSGASCTAETTGTAWNDYSPGVWTMSPVPVPPALWLFGSGLIGLASVARRKQ